MEEPKITLTKERKQALHLEMMNDRKKWIYSSSPYRSCAAITTHFQNHSFPSLQKFTSSHVSQQLPSAMQVLKVLYGIGQDEDQFDVSSENHFTLYDFDRRMWQNAIHVTQDTSLESLQSLSVDIIDNDISRNYHFLLTKLNTPEYNFIVKDIRQFVHGLEQMATKIQQDVASKELTAFQDSKAPITLTLRKFMDYIKDRVNHQFNWNTISIPQISTDNLSISQINSSWDELKDALLESFTYSKCSKTIALLLGDSEKQDTALDNKIQFLRTFIQPEHLDIHHFRVDAADSSGKNQFSESIRLIRVLDCLCAPSLILSYILKTYKSVCHVLDDIITTASGDSNSPGADEIFPTLIWTILCAHPKHLCTSLSLVDVLIPHEEIHGELGYAYTNFFSAVQFIKDLNVESAAEKDSSSNIKLSISREELQNALHKYQKNYPVTMEDTHSSVVTEPKHEEDTRLLGQSTLSVHAVRQARARGEAINLNWAMQYLNDHTSPSFESLQDMNHGQSFQVVTEPTQPFARVYPFLHVDVKDIRMSDIPLLLKEYQTLVQVVESLYKERSKAASIKRKKENQRTREELTRRAMEANELLSRSELEDMEHN